MKIVHIMTIPHTGTVFTLGLFELADKVDCVMSFTSEFRNVVADSPDDVVNIIKRFSDMDIRCSHMRKKNEVNVGYVILNHHLSMHFSRILLNCGNIIATIRHPYHTIYATIKRLRDSGMPNGWHHSVILDRYVDFIALIKLYPNCFVFPIDEMSKKTDNDRLSCMRRGLKLIGLDTNDKMQKYIIEWQKTNFANYDDFELLSGLNNEIIKDIQTSNILNLLNREFGTQYTLDGIAL